MPTSSPTVANARRVVHATHLVVSLGMAVYACGAHADSQWITTSGTAYIVGETTTELVLGSGELGESMTYPLYATDSWYQAEVVDTRVVLDEDNTLPSNAAFRPGVTGEASFSFEFSPDQSEALAEMDLLGTLRFVDPLVGGAATPTLTGRFTVEQPISLALNVDHAGVNDVRFTLADESHGNHTLVDVHYYRDPVTGRPIDGPMGLQAYKLDLAEGVYGFDFYSRAVTNPRGPNNTDAAASAVLSFQSTGTAVPTPSALAAGTIGLLASCLRRQAR